MTHQMMMTMMVVAEVYLGSVSGPWKKIVEWASILSFSTLAFHANHCSHSIQLTKFDRSGRWTWSQVRRSPEISMDVAHSLFRYQVIGIQGSWRALVRRQH
jgi:hypothetical protein